MDATFDLVILRNLRYECNDRVRTNMKEDKYARRVAFSDVLCPEYLEPEFSRCLSAKEKKKGKNYRARARRSPSRVSVLSRLRIARKSSSRYGDNRNFLDRLARECRRNSGG